MILGMLVILLIFAGSTAFFSTESQPGSLMVRAVVAVIWIFLALVLFIIMQLLLAAVIAYARGHKGLLGIHTLVVTAEGLIERTDYNETLHRWKGFHRVRESASYFYLYVSETNFHLVPKRSFTSGQELRSFLEEIKQRAGTAQS
jgi:hypothetical protein